MTTTADVARLVLEHMAEHGLPEPASLHISAAFGQAESRVQVRGDGLRDTVGVLLRWAGSVATVRFRAWRTRRDSVHLDVDTTLTGSGGTVALTVYGGVEFDHVTFTGLEIGAARPVSLGEFTAWATGGVGAPS
ncbi:MAG TPA: hypothetical protein VFW65_14755 [Pseudonocardiaceae bacterium]|nr:hypothetical protein [Pseudonocardiaceae bacterium]